MDIIDIIRNMDTQTIAEKIINQAADLDSTDYADRLKEDTAAIEECLYHIKTVASNKYNSDYWRTFCAALVYAFEYN